MLNLARLILLVLLAQGCRSRTLDEIDGLVTDGAIVDFARDMPKVADMPNANCAEVNGPRSNAPLHCNGMDCFSSNCCVNQTTNILQLCQSPMCQNGFNAFVCDDPQDCMGATCCFNHNGPLPFRATCSFGFCNGLAVCRKTSDCPAGSGLICRKMAGFPDGRGACQPPC